MTDCKNCKHGKTLYIREYDHATKITQHIPCGRVMCSSPKYGKRTYIVKDARADCPFFERRGHKGGDGVGE